MSWQPTIWCFVLAWSLTAGCRSPNRTATPGEQLELVQRSRPALGTYVAVTVYATNRAAGLQAISAAFAGIDRIDRLLSIHRDDTELARVNREAPAGVVSISAELEALLSSVLSISRETDGAFDPTIRPLADLWGFIWKEHRLPAESELARTLPLVGWQAVDLDPAAHTVRFNRTGMSLDPGGFGKGYAVDSAIAELKRLGITSALVRVGGDLRVIGAPPGRPAWPVQIEDPLKQGKRVTIPLRDRALSTSGSYENFFEIDGRRYSHILDPRTGMPVAGVASCTVIADTCMESDAWATALFVLGPDKALPRFAERFPARFVMTSDEPSGTMKVIAASNFPPDLDLQD